MNVALMFMLILVTPVTAEIDHLGAISDGIVHSAVADIVKEPIDNALSPTLVNYYICKDSGFPLEVIQSKEKCYTDVLDYIIVKPPNPIVVFIANMIVILFMVMFVIWCCYVIGRSTYQMFRLLNDSVANYHNFCKCLAVRTSKV